MNPRSPESGVGALITKLKLLITGRAEKCKGVEPPLKNSPIWRDELLLNSQVVLAQETRYLMWRPQRSESDKTHEIMASK